MMTALVGIFTPSTSLDVSRAVFAVCNERQPYTMALAGLDGGGESTKLLKTYCRPPQNLFGALTAASDMLRSDNVGQLRVLAKIALELYERDMTWM